MKKLLFATLTMLMLSVMMLAGCASVPMASIEDDARAKEFKVAPGKSSIYLFRNENFGGAIHLTIALDDKMQGQTAPYIYYLWEVDPGQHKITSFGENVENFMLNTKEGTAYFVRQEVKMGMWAARSALYEFPAGEGKDAVNKCKRAQVNSQQ